MKNASKNNSTVVKFRWLAVAVLLVASFMDLLDTTIVNVALPAIQESLGASSAQLVWIISGYALSFAVLLITGGRLGDRYGRKTVFNIGVLGFTLASLSCAFAQTPDMLVISRLVQGGFAAVMIPQVLSIIQVLFRPEERAAVFGLTGAISGLAAVAGPLIGGLLVSSDAFGLGWRSIFVINIPVGIALFIASLAVVPNSKSEKPVRLDPLGVGLIIAALFLVIYPLIQGREQGWPMWVWIMFASSAVLIGLFVALQRRQEKTSGGALIPLSLFNNRGFSAGVLTSFLAVSSIGAFFLIFALYLQAGLGFSALDAGLASLPFSLGAFFGSGIAVPLAPKVGKYLIAIGAVLQLIGYTLIKEVILTKGDGLVGGDLLLPLAIAGVGLTLILVPLADLALAQTDVQNAGAASGVLNTLQQVGGAIGVAVISVLFFDAVGANFSPAGLRGGFEVAIWAPLVAVALTGLSSLLLPSAAVLAAPKKTAAKARR
jgi:EmrB/QacA subfamily drug resistance transporter